MSKTARIAKWVLVAAVTAYAVAAITLVAAGLNDTLARADAIVVPGNTVAPDGTPSARLQARLDAALSVYRRGYAPRIIVSGAVGKEGHDEALVMAAYLVAQGVPAAAVLTDHAGVDTAATARNVAKMAAQPPVKSVLVATQYFHVPRTRLALQRAGVQVVGNVHARYAEWRDAYSLAREVLGYAAYWAGVRGV